TPAQTRPPATAEAPDPDSTPAPPAAKANRTPAAATAPEPAASQPAPAPARAAGEAAMTGPAPRATGTAGAGRWPRGSSPGRLPAVTRARCWCTPSPAGSAPRAC